MRAALLIFLSTSVLSAAAQTLLDSDYARPPHDSLQLPKKHPLIKPATIAAGYVAVTCLAYRYADEEVEEFSQANQNKVVYSGFQTVGYLGLGNASIAITVGTGITAMITQNERLKKATLLLIGGHLINDVVTNQLKVSFQRHRPNTGDPYNTFDWREGSKANESFVSSHTSNAFTTATVFALCFPNKKWVPIAAYSAASVVGLSRIYQNAHWTSDVLAGAAVGFLSAHAMNKLYNFAGKRLTFLPDVENSHFGATVVYTLK